MVTCSAYGCKETSSGEKGKGKTSETTKKLSWFKFPDPVKEPDRLALWESKVGVKNWKATTFSKLCGNHFEESMIEEDLRLKYMGDAKRCVQLVKGAVPTKFRRDPSGQWRVGPPRADDVDAAAADGIHCQQHRGSAVREHTVQRLARREQKRIVDDLLCEKKPIPAKVPLKTGKVCSSNATGQKSVTNVSVMVGAAGQQKTVYPDANICEVHSNHAIGMRSMSRRERWISILHHVVNKHRWTGCVIFKRCQHPTLSAAECRKKAWLKPGSSSFLALQEIVMNKFLLGSLPNLVDFYHTGSLEVFHNVILKYCPKRQHFGYRGMAARIMLGALDWNSMEREPVLNENGTQKLDLIFSKRRKAWVLRKRYKRKSGLQVQGLMKRTIQAHRDNIVLPPIVSPVLPRNISRVDKPNKEEAEAKHRTRFQKN